MSAFYLVVDDMARIIPRCAPRRPTSKLISPPRCLRRRSPRFRFSRISTRGLPAQSDRWIAHRMTCAEIPRTRRRSSASRIGSTNSRWPAARQSTARTGCEKHGSVRARDSARIGGDDPAGHRRSLWSEIESHLYSRWGTRARGAAAVGLRRMESPVGKTRQQALPQGAGPHPIDLDHPSDPARGPHGVRARRAGEDRASVFRPGDRQADRGRRAPLFHAPL